MAGETYRCRNSLLRTEVTWTLTDSTLESSAGARLRFADMASVRFYDVPGLRMAAGRTVLPAAGRCVIKPVRGRAIVLTSSHFLRLGRFEDRSANFMPFVGALLRRVAAVNPATRLSIGMPWLLWWLWSAVFLLLIVVCALAATIAIVEFRETGRISFEIIVLVPLACSFGFATISVVRLLRHGRTRQLELN